jgi:hypothetical protein
VTPEHLSTGAPFFSGNDGGGIDRLGVRQRRRARISAVRCHALLIEATFDPFKRF